MIYVCFSLGTKTKFVSINGFHVNLYVSVGESMRFRFVHMCLMKRFETLFSR